jgi:hypothetical protein
MKKTSTHFWLLTLLYNIKNLKKKLKMINIFFNPIEFMYFPRAQSSLTAFLLAPMLLLLFSLLGYFLHLPSPVSAQQNSSNSSSSNAVNANLLTRQRFAELIRYFTAKNWMFDYGGGMAIRVVQPNAAGRELVYVTANKYVKSHYDP